MHSSLPPPHLVEQLSTPPTWMEALWKFRISAWKSCSPASLCSLPLSEPQCVLVLGTDGSLSDVSHGWRVGEIEAYVSYCTATVSLPLMQAAGNTDIQHSCVLLRRTRLFESGRGVEVG